MRSKPVSSSPAPTRLPQMWSVRDFLDSRCRPYVISGRRHGSISARATSIACDFQRLRCVRLSAGSRRLRTDTDWISSTRSLVWSRARDEEASHKAEMGSGSYNRLHGSTTWNLHWVRGRNREKDGAKGCFTEGYRVRNPDDSVLHQSRRQE